MSHSLPFFLGSSFRCATCWSTALLVMALGFQAGCQGEELSVVEPSARLIESTTALQLYVGQQQERIIEVENDGPIPVTIELELSSSSESASAWVVQDGLQVRPGEVQQLLVGLEAVTPGFTRVELTMSHNGESLTTGALLVDVQAPPSCDDDNLCTEDAFDVAIGSCIHRPARQGQSCDDDNLCVQDAALPPKMQASGQSESS
ncbi:MAG: hypothetical protein GY822_18160 [Deltaproteobacteria bacterium]|nr:hypothetical protein [Deltaproteobacteria bacterium]